MNKYINAAELKLILNREHLNYSQMIEKKFVLNAIDEMPSADVVEVVRCRDCKHLAGWDESHPHDFIYNCDRRIIENKVLLDDFCSYGERKESKVKKCFDIPIEVVKRLLEDMERKETE